MISLLRLRVKMFCLAVPVVLTACGGGSDSGPPATSTSVVQASQLEVLPGAPQTVGNVPAEGLAWINYRRVQAGLTPVSRNTRIDIAAQGHSSYQTQYGIGHSQDPIKQGFTGATLRDRFTAAGYGYSYLSGEVISGTSSSSGFYMAEELITAIYHRFVIFEPKFTEIGTGASTDSRGYTIFTVNFSSSDGQMGGVGANEIIVWPFNNQTLVTPNFFSDLEEPDPVQGMNEVGYPISIHANVTSEISVSSFTVRPRGGAELAVKILSPGSMYTARSVAAIIPLAPLNPATVYDVSFVGTVDGAPTVRAWAFTTR